MLYRVVINGEDLLDYNDPEMVLLSPRAEIELDVSGSFEFTVPPNHKMYDLFTAESIMPMTVEIYESDILQWFGRPIELHLDFYKNKKIYCEGALGFFNDSVIRTAEYEETSLSTIFAAVIAEHNSMVPSNRQFTIGQFTVTDDAVYRKFDYEQTSDVLKSKFLDAVEGHFFVRRENGVNYIDFLKDMPYTCNQVVQFAKNLLNFTYSFDGKDFATCVIPLGATDGETGKATTIASANRGSDILVGNAAANYGNIVKVQHYSDLTDPGELMSEGQKYLTNLQYNAFLIECSAVDLHVSDETKNQFRVGQKVNCVSDPHGINLELPISKMTLYLDSAAKQITLGRIPKKTLSRFYKDKVANTESGTEENEIPDGWAIVPPDTDGGEPTLKKVPVRIMIVELPYQTSYQEGETFDPTGIIVTPLAKGLPDLTYFLDSRYTQAPFKDYAEIPMSELSFTYQSNGSQIALTSSTVISNISQARITVWVWWTCPYDGKKHGQAFYITNEKQKAIDEANGPDHIVMEILPAQLEYYTGGYIHLSGAKVVAYMENDQPYTGNGYANGVIPNSELTLDPAIADKDAAIKSGTASSDILPEGINNPFDFGGSNKITYHSNDYVGGKRFDATLTGERVTGHVFKTNAGSGHGISIVASAEPSTAHYVTQYYRKSDGEPSHSNDNEYELSSTATYHGKTVYYTTARTYASVSTIESEFECASGINDDVNYGAVAWAMVYGDTEITNKQTITVKWNAPNGNELTTDFEITIKESQHGR